MHTEEWVVTARAVRNGRNLAINIPTAAVEEMGILKGEYLIVSIRKLKKDGDRSG